MTKEQWLETKEKIDDAFGIDKEGTEQEGQSTIEWIMFKNPKGVMKLEWHDEPKKIDEHTLSSKRIGSNVTIEPVYSQTERIQRIVLLLQEPKTGEWIESDASLGF